MGRLCEHWGRIPPGTCGYSGVGAVVGATYPEQLKELRQALPHLLPCPRLRGAGRRRGRRGPARLDQNGLGAVVNASRSTIMCAWKRRTASEDFAQAARREALRMKEDILSHIRTIRLP